MNEGRSIPPRASRTSRRQRVTEEQVAVPHAALLSTKRTTAVPADVWDEEEEERATRASQSPRSALRLTTEPAQRHLPVVPPPPARHPHTQRHPLLYIGVGMASAAIIVAVLLVGGNWWQQQTTTWTYGYPRTYQTDAVVGHHDSTSHPSHFLAENLHGQIVVIEFPGDDPSQGRDFLVTTLSGPGSDRVPVTLSFADVNHDGKPDLLIHVDGQIVVYLNDHGTFRPLKPGEQVPSVQ